MAAAEAGGLSPGPPGSVVEGLNNAWREGFGQTLSGADKRDLADRLGVDVRTVQRWTTQAGQQRNAFPANLANREVGQWSGAQRDRASVTSALQSGASNQGGQAVNPAGYREVFSRPSDAVTYGRAMQKPGQLDPWVHDSWREWKIVKTADGWELQVVYDRSLST